MRTTSCHWVLLLLWVSGLSLGAKPSVQDPPNPFAPLKSSSESVAPAPDKEAQVQSNPKTTPASIQDINVPALAGIVWSPTMSFAVLGDTIVGINGSVGSCKVTQIGPTMVVIADANQSRVLSMPGFFESSAVEKDLSSTDTHTVVHTHDALVRQVLECLAIEAGTSIVFPSDIQCRVSLRLWNVDWDTAFQTVLQAGGYTARKEGRIWMVSDGQKAFVTETFSLKYASAKTVEETITRLLSTEGKMGTDTRRNAVIITDRAAQLERIREAIRQIDARAPQVLIDVLIVNVKLTHELKMGVDWTAVSHLKDGTTLTLEQGLSATGATPPFGQIQVSKTASDWSLEGLMDFIETHENVKVLANPKVLVMNSQTATIDSVEEIPYQELSQTSGGGNIGTTAFKEAGVKLEVTPQISADGTIILHIKPEQSAQIGVFRIQGSDTPVIETRKAETTLQVRDGQTIIIGGLRKQQPSRNVAKVPILGDLPLVGSLFRQVNNKEIESELGVFITPRIWTDAGLPDAERALLEKQARDLKSGSEKESERPATEETDGSDPSKSPVPVDIEEKGEGG